MGDSPELSLALALVAHPPRGLHLHDLQRTGVLTEVLAVVGAVGHGLVARKRTQGESVRSGGHCGALLASVLLPAAATVVFSGLGKRVAGVVRAIL
jgi:hypothetical protein